MIRGVFVSFVLLACTACGPGGADFVEDAALAPEALMGEFKDLPLSSSALTIVDASLSPVKVEQQSERSLLIKVPSTEEGGESTFLLEFSCGSDCAHSRVAVTIDVPATKIDTTKVLDERKVERAFHQAVQSLIHDKEAGESVQPATRAFVDLFDALRIINNPATRERIAAAASGRSPSLGSFSPPTLTPGGGWDGPAEPQQRSGSRYSDWAQASVRQDEAEDRRRERAMSN